MSSVWTQLEPYSHSEQHSQSFTSTAGGLVNANMLTDEWIVNAGSGV